MTENKKSCYELCNDKYSAMTPGRLFCKKGCDSDESDILVCKSETCNKLCIKTDQGDPKLWFSFLYRAPANPELCLEACIYGCNRKVPED